MAKVEPGLLSIGDICSETGLSADVVRVWERRYGFPVPVRLPSGHRRYRQEDLHQLRLMAEAVAQGHRPSLVARTGEAALKRLLIPRDNPRVERLFEAVAALDTDGMRGLLKESIGQLGWKPFLQQVVAPLLDRVGMAWADGTIDIHHEHLVTEVLEDLLRQLRLDCRILPGLGSVLLCTLPGERHRLGLLMAALAYASQGIRTELLGVDLPVASIAQAARALKVDRVAVSLSIQSSGETTRRLLMDLKDRLPAGCRLLIGGQGAVRTRKIEGVERMSGLEVL
ncbi:MAG: cobalamin B12-binding domain-containing protein [Geothrix sp.]|uniref:MerR family transcriptional regulator n=1 Tax=Geothrix sp. TaxID=1962974 RepID=UPI0018256D2F|nr:MerR family transcriptional regulator [Geothrix sp.]NWJ40946.1 cobalamin B12-binding domain-containing protein [Geothrix sp.]WIL21054.1 MAG: MerR family transcriptional regulator [Geothrix sp.]